MVEQKIRQHKERKPERQIAVKDEVAPGEMQSANPSAQTEEISQLIILSDHQFEHKVSAMLKMLDDKSRKSKLMAGLAPAQKEELALFLASMQEEQLRKVLDGGAVEKIRMVSEQTCPDGVVCALNLAKRDHSLSSHTVFRQGINQVAGKRKELLSPVIRKFEESCQDAIVCGFTDKAKLTKLIANRNPSADPKGIERNVDQILQLVANSEDAADPSDLQVLLLEGLTEKGTEVLVSILENFDKKYLSEELRELIKDQDNPLTQKILEEARELIKDGPATEDHINTAALLLINEITSAIVTEAKADFKQELLKAGARAVIKGLADVKLILNGQKNKDSAVLQIVENRRAGETVIINLAENAPKVAELISYELKIPEPLNEARASRVKKVMVDRDGRIWLCDGIINAHSGNYEIEHKEEIHLNEFSDLRFAGNF